MSGQKLEKVNYTIENIVAKAAFHNFEKYLNQKQKEIFYNSFISQDRNIWCIQAGPDLINDYSGFGKTISDAVEDFISCLKANY